MRLARWILLLAVLAVAVPGATDGARAPAQGVVGLERRLESLDPSDPMAYFLLAEEVAYEEPGDAGRDLARHLFILSFELDQRRDGRLGLGRSVCLALADMAQGEDDRRWLRALAGVALIGEQRVADEEQGIDEEAAHALCEMLEKFRGERNREAREILRRPGVHELFEREKGPLRRAGFTETAVESHPSCRECRNRRVVSAGREGELTVCPTCGGNPGPRLSAEQFVRQIVFESRVAGIDQQAWSAQLQVDFGEPLRELDPRELAAWFNVDLRKVVWRRDESGKGAWREQGAPVP